MRLILPQAIGHDLLPDGLQHLFAEQSIDGPIRINDDECRPDTGKNIIFLVSPEDIIEHLWLVEDIHVAHISEILLVCRLKRLVDRKFDTDGSTLSLERVFGSTIRNRG